MTTTDLVPYAVARNLARLLAGLPQDADATPADWAWLIAPVASANGHGRRAAFDEALAGREDANAIRAQVLDTDPNAPPDEQAQTEIEPPAHPPLPDVAHVDPAIGAEAGNWIDEYCSFAAAVSPMTPDLFHESGALCLASIAIARRLKVPMPFADVYPNLFNCWLAPTTLFNKTTGLDVMRCEARNAFPHLLAPQDTTPEAMLSDMAGREPLHLDQASEADQDLWQKERNFAAQRGLLLDEMSGLLASAGRDYGAGLVEALLRFYDCDSHFTRSTRSQGRIIIHNAYLVLLGASTPAALAPHLSNETLWANGFWPRFALLTPEVERPEWAMARYAERSVLLGQGLRFLYNALPITTWPDPPRALSVTLGKGVYEAWERRNRVYRYDLLTDDLDKWLWGTYGRLPVQALKVGTILAALDWNGESTPTIEMRHLARALSIIEAWRASAHRALGMAQVNNFEAFRVRILKQLGRFEPEGATLRDLYKNMKDKEPSEIEHLLQQMQATSEVEQIKKEAGPKGGRPTVKYRIARG